MNAPATLQAATCAGVLAVELAAGRAPAAQMLPTEAATALVGHVARDLARLLPGVEAMGLALAGALFDQAQILRPGWPVFARLAALHREHVRSSETTAIVAFGSSGGPMIDPGLVPEPAATETSLLVIPFVLLGDASSTHAIGARMERELGERGLADAATALFLGHAFSVGIEHARYLTRDDLCALCALQLEHAGLGPAWEMIEAALFAPDAAAHACTVTGQALRQAGARVEIGLMGLSAWSHGPGRSLAPASRTDAFLHWQREQRRHAALFAAHGLAVDFGCGEATATATCDAGYWIEPGVAPRDPQAQYALFAHTAEDLGIVALSVAMRRDDAWTEVARGYPLARTGLTALRAALAARYATGDALRLAPLALDPAADGFVLPR